MRDGRLTRGRAALTLAAALLTIARVEPVASVWVPLVSAVTAATVVIAIAAALRHRKRRERVVAVRLGGGSLRDLVIGARYRRERLDEAFPDAPAQELLRASRHIPTYVFEPGETIVAPGDEADRLFVITEGEAVFTEVDAEGREHETGMLASGGFVGEEMLVPGSTHTRELRARTRVRVMAVDPEVLAPAAVAEIVAAPVAEAAAAPERATVGVGDAAAAANADVVDCSVFAPPVVARGEAFLVQVFAHLVEQAEDAQRLATEFDPDARRRAVKTLLATVPRGSQLDVDLSLPGLEVVDPRQSLVWTGRPEAVQFEVDVPAESSARRAIGTATVSRDSIPIGHVKFAVTVAEAPTGTPEPEPAGDDAVRYTMVFVSYASEDREKVLARIQGLAAVGIRYFHDVLVLEPGARWEEGLYKNIDDCDLFLLFWSAAAKGSEWVRKEVAYALRRKGGDDYAPPEIKPVILEGPPVPEPWAELAHLHFNDKIRYFMTQDAG